MERECNSSLSQKTMWPELTVILVTYDRPREIRTTIEALINNIRYDGNITWHIADDSSPGTYISDIIHDFPGLTWKASVTPRRGWGANVNKALVSVKSNFIFVCEDDYVALREIDLNRGVALLKAEKSLGVIRYDGLAGHVGLQMQLKEVQTEDMGKLDYLLIDRQHSDHLNVYSNRPHLRHRRLHDNLGMYRETLPLGETETEYAHRVLDTENCPEFAILSTGIPRAFEHIGHTRQGTGLDPNWKTG